METNQPNYLNAEQARREKRRKETLRSIIILAYVNFVAGGISFMVFLAFALMALITPRPSFEPADIRWLFPLASTFTFFLYYGILAASAYITENMIEVGDYIRQLRAQNYQ